MESETEEKTEHNGDKEMGATAPVPSPSPSRDEVLELLADAIETAHHKIRGGSRTRHVDRDKLKIDWIKALGYIVNIYLSGLKDLELEKLNERIKKLEEHFLEKQRRLENQQINNSSG